jgi:hypothetical protein
LIARSAKAWIFCSCVSMSSCSYHQLFQLEAIRVPSLCRHVTACHIMCYATDRFAAPQNQLFVFGTLWCQERTAAPDCFTIAGARRPPWAWRLGGGQAAKYIPRCSHPDPSVPISATRVYGVDFAHPRSFIYSRHTCVFRILIGSSISVLAIRFTLMHPRRHKC